MVNYDMNHISVKINWIN